MKDIFHICIENLTEVENFKFTLGKLLRKAKYTDSYVKMLLFKNDM